MGACVEEDRPFRESPQLRREMKLGRVYASSAGSILGRSWDIILKIWRNFAGVLSGQVASGSWWVTDELNLHVLSQRVWR